MQKHYTFIGRDAEKYGTNCAIVLHTIKYFVLSNRKFKRNCFNGKYWVYNSAKKWTRYFPFFSHHQIYRHLKHLEKSGAILVDSFNKRGYDKTLWHTLSDAELRSCLRDEYWKKRMAELQSTHCGIAKPIPNINNNIIIEPY
jgi:hypothetical protein